ncbi:glycoside hydrolase family 20 protein [Aureispira anguillae]|uniref:beta-N-acetylhexosaminidase n=1 Tax=Aureispira anguillae TaxID=2864201 RepID=A0A916DRG4_9BACT|nr:glycoside hydrolase family 20 protein [Aureispira anguillae]BDS10196.1 glycoside hydrolase family 20 protein [Aureispira anguillae]
MPYIVYALCLLLLASCINQPEQSTEEALLTRKEISVVPLPQKITKTSSTFVLNKETVLVADAAYEQEAQYLKNLLNASLFFELKTAPTMPTGSTNYIQIGTLKSTETTTAESYYMNIDSNGISINSADAAGIFRGIQTLRQLFHPNFHQKEKRSAWGLPTLTINDSPAFKWRGMLLDCCRHFFSKEVIKKYIDLLAFYKMNTLHWHLTEDQGWRIAIDKYPKLAEISAWRTGKDGKPYGGFYSKEDIKELVAYAQERHITIVPEIELPGHSQAAIAAYPHLSCTGKQLEVGTKWGVFKDVYCAGNDSTFQFLEDVLTEVIELFPSQYIHIGGDECPKYRWEHCAKCQKRIKEEQLKDEHELQSYFIKRIAKFLARHNKKLIGWDEILEGGLAENATVQSWRGMGGALDAANQNQYAISSPTSHAYFDYKLNAIDLEKVYSFNPIPKALPTEKHSFILGGECNMWTERVPNEQVLDQKVFPRLLAMAEVLWSAPVERDYPAFYQRVQGQYPSLDAFDVHYGAETVPIRLETFTSTQSINIKLTKGAEDLTLYYTTDGSTPSTNAQKYDGAIALKENTILTVQAFKKEKPYGEALSRTFNKHLANGLEPILSYNYSSYYTGGGIAAVTNGARGSGNFRDGNWQAVQKVPMEITIDLQKTQPLSKLAVSFFQKQDSWIFLPVEVDFFTSDDGKRFSLVGSIKNTTSPQKEGEFIESFELPLKDQSARYVRLKAHNIAHCPDWHAAAGAEAWLFIDEFIVE